MGNLGGAIVNEPSTIYNEISKDNEKLKSYFKSLKLLTAKYLSTVKPSAYSTPTNRPKS